MVVAAALRVPARIRGLADGRTAERHHAGGHHGVHVGAHERVVVRARSHVLHAELLRRVGSVLGDADLLAPGMRAMQHSIAHSGAEMVVAACLAITTGGSCGAGWRRVVRHPALADAHEAIVHAAGAEVAVWLSPLVAP